MKTSLLLVSNLHNDSFLMAMRQEVLDPNPPNLSIEASSAIDRYFPHAAWRSYPSLFALLLCSVTTLDDATAVLDYYFQGLPFDDVRPTLVALAEYDCYSVEVPEILEWAHAEEIFLQRLLAKQDMKGHVSMRIVSDGTERAFPAEEILMKALKIYQLDLLFGHPHIQASSNRLYRIGQTWIVESFLEENRSAQRYQTYSQAFLAWLRLLQRDPQSWNRVS